jgi:abequosyltransferase
MINEVEITISDNASTDDTFCVVESARRSSSARIIYTRNKVNIGADRNMIAALSLASGCFCWSLADDDQILPGSVLHILSELKKRPEIDVFLCNHREFDLDSKKELEHFQGLALNHDAVFDFRSKGEISSYLKLVNNLSGLFGFSSALVCKRSKVLGVLKNAEFVGTDGTDYINLFIPLQLLWGPARGVLKFINTPLVLMGIGEQRTMDKQAIKRAKMEIELYHLLVASVLKNADLVRLADNVILKSGGFSQVVNAKINGGRDFYSQIFPVLFRYYWSYPVFWLKMVPILFIPGSVLVFMRNLYRFHLKFFLLGRSRS